jgi:hypothetical protein
VGTRATQHDGSAALGRIAGAHLIALARGEVVPNGAQASS